MTTIRSDDKTGRPSECHDGGLPQGAKISCSFRLSPSITDDAVRRYFRNEMSDHSPVCMAGSEVTALPTIFRRRHACIASYAEDCIVLGVSMNCATRSPYADGVEDGYKILN